FSSRTETQGLVLLEAMALGIPVVSTAMMGTKEVLRDGEGALIAIENVTDFATKVISVLKDPQLRQNMRDKARTYAKTWSVPHLTKRLLSYYRQIKSIN
ncbi:glycosyl transferase family 1, partial [Achromatium sp. WMS1]